MRRTRVWGPSGHVTSLTSRSAVDRPLLAPVALVAISVYDIRERERQFPPQPPAKLLSLPPSASAPFPSSFAMYPRKSFAARSFLGTSACISNKLQYCGITSLSRVMDVCAFPPLVMDIGYWACYISIEGQKICLGFPNCTIWFCVACAPAFALVITIPQMGPTMQLACR